MEKGYKPPASDGSALPQGFKIAMSIFAAISAIFGIGLALWPFLPGSQGQPSAVPWWAWTLTPLTAHVAGGWYLAAATLQYTLSRQRSINTVGPSLLGLMLVTGAQLVGAILHAGAFNGPLFFIALYLINCFSVFTFATYVFVRNRASFSLTDSRALV
jgi:hypothetical protein